MPKNKEKQDIKECLFKNEKYMLETIKKNQILKIKDN